MLVEECFELVAVLGRLGHDRDVVNEDRDNDLDALSFPDVDGSVRHKTFVARSFQDFRETLIPEATGLLDTIETLLEVIDPNSTA